MSGKLKDEIIENGFFRIDFDGKYKRDKKLGITQEVKYFLIAVTPVIIVWPDGKREAAGIMAHKLMESDPALRMMHNVRFSKLDECEPLMRKKLKGIEKEDGYYVAAGREVIERCRAAIDKAIRTKTLNGKKFESLTIYKSPKSKSDAKKEKK